MVKQILIPTDGSEYGKAALEYGIHLAEKLGEKVKTSLTPFNINNEFVILSGKEDRQLIQFIREGAVQLMVMGAYGHNKLRRVLLGSTTSYVIRKGAIPVLLTR